jgi:dTDP-4-dehydrorhamnose reductase
VVRQFARAGEGATILALAGQQEVDVTGVPVHRVDLRDGPALRACVAGFRPTHVIHLGAMTAVGDCHAHPADAECINTAATRVLAEAARDAGARFVFSSTDMVFDGEHAPYRESDSPSPLSHYGRTKAAAEELLAEFDGVLVVRLPLMYGLPCGPRATTFVAQIAALRAGQALRLFTDEYRTPVWLADAARAVIGLARTEIAGLIHVAGPQRLSRYELIAECARVLGVSRPNLVPVSRLALAAAEPRPADLSLDGERLTEWFPDLVPGPLHRGVFAEG